MCFAEAYFKHENVPEITICNLHNVYNSEVRMEVAGISFYVEQKKCDCFVDLYFNCVQCNRILYCEN